MMPIESSNFYTIFQKRVEDILEDLNRTFVHVDANNIVLIDENEEGLQNLINGAEIFFRFANTCQRKEEF
jgi:hypothetical protein